MGTIIITKRTSMKNATSLCVAENKKKNSRKWNEKRERGKKVCEKKNMWKTMKSIMKTEMSTLYRWIAYSFHVFCIYMNLWHTFQQSLLFNIHWRLCVCTAFLYYTFFTYSRKNEKKHDEICSVFPHHGYGYSIFCWSFSFVC